MLIYYVENEIDKKYQQIFLKSLLPKLLSGISDDNQLYLFYRKVPGLVHSSNILEFLEKPSKKLLDKGEFKKCTTIPRLLKLMNTRETKSTLITCYNFQKRGINKYSRINVINLGHSISGNTRYNLRVWVDESKPGSVSLVPSFFGKVAEGDYAGRNRDRRKIELDTYYKLMYTLGKPVAPSSISMDQTVLFLPHWTTPIGKVHEIAKATAEKLPEGYRLLIKLHPASIYETTIFLNRTIKEDATDVDSERQKSAQLEQYNATVAEINNIPGVFIFNDDELELVDAIDASKYVMFDGHSNTLPETIFRSIYHDQVKKIVVVDPKLHNPSYVLPDLFGYKFVDGIQSIDDFKAPNVELMLSYIDVKAPNFMEKVVEEYSSIITRLVTSTNEETKI